MDLDYKPDEAYEPNEFEKQLSVKRENKFEVILALIGTIGLNLIVIVILVPLVLLIGNTVSEDAAIYFQEIWGNMLVYGIAFIIMVLLLYFYKYLTPLLKQFTKLDSYIWGFVFGVAIIFAQMAYGIFTSTVFGDIPVNENQDTIVRIIKANPIVAAIWIPFIGPLVEELTYRRGLFSRLRKISFPIAIVVTSLIFGLVHFSVPIIQETGQIDMTLLRYELINLPGYIISGLIFCYAYEKHGFATSSIAHILNNLFAFAVTFLV